MTATRTRTRKRASVVDPRIQARRREVKRNEGRRRFRILLGLGAVTALVAGAIGLANSPLLDVDRVLVEGVVRSDPVEVVSASGVAKGQPLHEVDIGRGELALEALPWVAEARIDRALDGDVTLSIVEREPVAVLRSDDGFVLVDAAGRQLAEVDGWSPEFLPIAGLSASGVLGQPVPPEAHGAIRLMEQMVPVVAERSSQVIVDDGVLYLNLADGGRVKLGDDSSMYEKMVALETMLARVDLRCLWEIDVRVPSAPALTRLAADGDPQTPVSDLADCR